MTSPRHYQAIIDTLPSRPILIGHSFGGMIAEKLLGLDYGAAAIGIDAAQIKGVLPLPLSALHSTLPVFKNPANKHKAVSLTAEQFRFSFGNAVSEEESNALYERWAIPAPGKPLFEAAVANFSLHSPAKVNTGNEGRGPLLLVMGGQDHTVPEAITKATVKQYRHSSRRHRARGVPGPRPLPDHRQRLARGRRPVPGLAGQAGAVTAPARPGADTMMALRAHARGGPEQLVYEQAPAPVPGPGEALVAVHAAGITFAELTWDLSWTTKDGRDRTPVIPAHEMSGIVAGLADGVTGVAVGDEVYALIDFDRDGAAAEFTTVPAAELAAKPRSASHAEAATLPLAALTAWQALADYAALEPGERVLVHGGAGGVGAFAVQLAAILGGRVTATGRSGDAAFVRDLGAEAFVSAGDPGSGRVRRRHRHRRRRGPGRLLPPAAGRGAAGHPQCAAVAGTREGIRRACHVLRRHARPRRTGPAREPGGRGPPAHGGEPDLPARGRPPRLRERRPPRPPGKTVLTVR